MPLIASKDYGEIGQTLESIGWSLDYICPMVYPSHYANNAEKGSMSNKVGQTINGIKFTHPDLKPYEVVYNTLVVGSNRISKVENYNLKMRPYIQGFTAKYLPEGYYMTYGADAYRKQIQAVYDAAMTNGSSGTPPIPMWRRPSFLNRIFPPKDELFVILCLYKV
jgi:hypothetical protein